MTSYVNTAQIFPGIFLGIILLAVVYNVVSYLSFKDGSYLYLIVFFITGAVSVLLISGNNIQITEAGLGWLPNHSLPLLILAALASSIEFARLYLGTKYLTPVWQIVLTWERNLSIAGIIICFIIKQLWLTEITIVLAPAVILTIVITGFISYKSGNPKGIIVACLWGLFLMSLIPIILKSFGIIPDIFLSEWSIQIGFLSLIILTPVTIHFRIAEERNENSAVQANLVESLKNSEQKLREDVQEQTEEINKINVMLMDRAIELGSINQLSEKINSSLNMDEILQSACVELVKIFPVQSAGIVLLNQNEEKFITKAYYKIDQAASNLKIEISLEGNTPFLDLIESKKPVILENISGSHFKKYIFESERVKEGDTVLIVPIISLREVTGAIILPTAEPDYKFTKNQIDLAKIIAVQVAGSVENARLYSQTEKALGTAVNDLEIGRQIQADFLPGVLREIEGWEFYPYFKAARQVSGDFYDAFQINNSGYTAFIIGDVCDKGVGAALFMVLFRSLLRAFSLKEKGFSDVKSFLKYIITSTNNYISETHNRANMFAALFYGIIDPQNNEIHYINGGLEAPVILDRSGIVIKRLDPTGPVVGMFTDMNFNVKSVRLNPGDILFAYTDGTTEAKNSSRELFGEESLLRAITSPWSSAFSMQFNLNTFLSRHIGTGEQYDDITQIVLRRRLFPEDNKHSIVRKASTDNLGELRDFVEKAVIHCRLNKDFVFAFRLVTEEICTNIIKYSYEGKETGDIKIEFEIEKEAALLKISDYGEHYRPEETDSADINADWETRKIGGLGITLVKGFMDKVEYTREPDNSNCFALRKFLK